VAEDYGLFPPPARKVALRGDLFRELRNLAPRLTWADYLEYAVRDLACLPVAYDLFKETGYELIPPSDEMARAVLDAVAALPDASAGLSTGLRHMDTRALGDLYEHLMDEGERKRLGYYTTPDFIIDFLLERTLEPAVREFGVYELRYLDPACGTGHFLVRAYRRLDHHLEREDPYLSPLERFERIVENNLFGIDVSEFATRITLFRLFLEGVRLAQQEKVDLAR
jgi:type I restriction-modification system DNA methylase subunit